MPIPVILSLIRCRAVRFALIGLLLAGMFLLALDSMRRESLTIDEPLHLMSGYVSWTFNDYRLQVKHGQLSERWFALPLLVENVQFPFRDDESWHHPGYLGWKACQNFFFNSGNNPDMMVFSGRFMAVVLTLAAVLAVYGWTTRVFGSKAGLLACFLCALDPTMLAHGRLMTSDVAAALFFLMSVGCFWNLLRRFTYFRLAASAVCCGLLMATKMSGGLVMPIALLMFLFRVALRRPWPVQLSGISLRPVRTWGGKACLAGGAALVHAVVALTMIWCVCGWQYQPSPDWNVDRDSYTEPRNSVFGSVGPKQAVLTALGRWKVLPDAYLYGLAFTLNEQAQHPGYLNNQYSSTGWWYYFPYCFMVKTPLTLMAFIAFGVAGIVWRIARRSNRRRAALWAWLDRTSLIWSLVLVYGTAAIFSNSNIGQRLVLPVYPPLFMLAGTAGWWFLRGRRRIRAMMVLLLMMQFVVVARIHPHYLAYFNELVGGSDNGYRHLTDSNVDWGQDLPSLARWLREHSDLTNTGDLYVSYFGFDSPARWGIRAHPFPGISNPQLSSADPLICRAGTYCFSATRLIMPGKGRPPWNEEYEREYRDLLAKFPEIARTSPPRWGDAESLEMWRPFLIMLTECQFDRLRNYLIGRKPDAMIGYSILIFHLSDAELHAALLP
jgi:hypothetical protein